MSDADETTELENREWIEQKLSQVPFVNFDRFTTSEWTGQQAVSVYGWIDREDTYKDFLLIIFWPEIEEFYFITSSAERTEEIHRCLLDDVEGHTDCRRVENAFGVSNVVSMEGDDA